MPPNKWDEESDGEQNTKVTSTVAFRAPKSKWADEEEDDVVDSWDAAASDSEEERKKAKKAAEKAAKETAEKKTKTQRIEEKIALNAAKKAAEEEERLALENETPEERKRKQQQREIEADMKHAEDLFGGAFAGGSARGSGTSTPLSVRGGSIARDTDSNAGDIKRKAISVIDPNDQTKSIDLSSLPMFNPTTKDSFNQLRTVLEPLLTANNKKAHYPLFIQEFIRALVKDMTSEQIRKVASIVTTLANEKQKEEKAAEKGGKKNNKAKNKTSLAAVTKESDKVDVTNYSDVYDDFDDFM